MEKVISSYETMFVVDLTNGEEACKEESEARYDPEIER